MGSRIGSCAEGSCDSARADGAAAATGTEPSGPATDGDSSRSPAVGTSISASGAYDSILTAGDPWGAATGGGWARAGRESRTRTVAGGVVWTPAAGDGA